MEPPPFSAASVVADPVLDVTAVLLIIGGGAGYVSGVVRLRRKGRRWNPWRTASFSVGLAVVALGTVSGIAAYDTVLFSVHTVQHVLLGMMAPILVALGAPVTLALQASSRPTQGNILHALHSRPVAYLTHPVVVLAVYVGMQFVVYFSPLFELALGNDVVHAWLHVVYISAGLLFCWLVLGLDPTTTRLSHPARLGLLLLAMPVHAMLGVAIMSRASLLGGAWYATVERSWGASPLSDQRTGGGILWVAGTMLGVLAVGIVLTQWLRHEERQAIRLDRAEQPPDEPVRLGRAAEQPSRRPPSPPEGVGRP